MSSLSKQWRVQVRSNLHAPWRNKGLFETRAVAREERDLQRDYFGFRNSRVIKYVRGAK